MVLAGATVAKSGEAVKAGPIGLAVILLLCIACYFLFKSMSKHMKQVREHFPTSEPPAASPPESPASPASPASASPVAEVQHAELGSAEPVEPVDPVHPVRHPDQPEA